MNATSYIYFVARQSFYTCLAFFTCTENRMKLRLHNVHRTMMMSIANGIVNRAKLYTFDNNLHKDTLTILLGTFAKHEP